MGTAEISLAAQAVDSMVGLGHKSGLGEAPAGVVLLYPGGAHLQVLIGEWQGEAREQLRQALREAADEL